MKLSDEMREWPMRDDFPPFKTYSIIVGWADRVARLERVATAAEECWPYMFDDLPKRGMKRVRYEQFYETLKELREE